jgi:hypothetical protein
MKNIVAGTTYILYLAQRMCQIENAIVAVAD